MDTEKVDRDLYNKIAAQYAKKDLAKSSSLARKFQLISAVRPLLRERKGFDTILEVGCGPGASAKYLEGYFKKFIGVDQSDEIINCANSLFKKENIEFVVSNIKDFNFEKIADLVLIVGSLHHMTELDQIMERLKKIAKPDAFFVAIEAQRTNPIIQFVRRLRQMVDSTYSEKQHYFSPEELRQLLASHGIKVLDVEYQGYFFPPFAQVILWPQFIFAPLAFLATVVDSFIAKYFPDFLKRFSWNIVIRGQF